MQEAFRVPECSKRGWAPWAMDTNFPKRVQMLTVSAPRQDEHRSLFFSFLFWNNFRFSEKLQR